MSEKITVKIGGKEVTLETGKIAKQAGGSVTVRMGDTIVLVAATASNHPSENRSFLPLSVNYIEKTFAAGKIPGGFFKREGRPSEKETLTSRFIDRPIRPLFPKGYFNETQVIATVLSSDSDSESDILAIIGASASLMLSPAPFKGPIAGLRIGRINGSFVTNPTEKELESSDIDIVVAGTKDAVVMVEGGAALVPEKDILEAISFAHKEMQPLIEAQLELVKRAGKTKMPDPVITENIELKNQVKDFLKDKIRKAITIPTKQERYAAIAALEDELVQKLVPENSAETLEEEVKSFFSEEKKAFVREMIFAEKKRIDGRGYKDIRRIDCEVSLLPRAHGSALFTRGETQALAATTLGTKEDQQLIDDLGGEYYKRFMLHYNFPPFSVGEVKMMRSPGRREIGHGALAERAILRVLPNEEKFPYTIRVVSEVLESNGSSSMATICGATLSLMDAGVPISAPVAGVAMGLIKEGDKTAILTDILGDEDHLGDMDFKVAGTKDGVSAIQMDIKIGGITYDILNTALQQACEARLKIIENMEKALSAPRAELSPYAPKLTVLKIPTDRIGDLIGPGGKNIRGIISETGATIDINDDGTVVIGAVDQASGDKAIKLVKRYTAVPEVGKYYVGRVMRVVDFGAFVEIMPKIEGLVHISHIDNKRIAKVTDVIKEGDVITVKVIEIDPDSGKIRLSRKEALGHENEAESI